MSAAAFETTPARFTSVWCRIESCRRPVDGNVGGRYCLVHRRTLRFSATLNDALNEFLSSNSGFMRPSANNANDVREAGELFALGMAKMFGAAFGVAVLVDPTPIALESATGRKDEARKRWHVSFRWQESDEDVTVYEPVDFDDETEDETDDD